KNIMLALIDKKRGAIISSSLRTIEVSPIDDVMPGSLKIDTARYQLSERIRAIALRYNSGAVRRSCAKSTSGDELMLYAQEANSLRPLLKLYMHQQIAFSGCIGRNTGDDSGEVASLSVVIDKTKSHGLYDIKLLADILSYDTNNESHSLEYVKKRIESYYMKYDGRAYKNADENPPIWMIQDNYE
ncbi:MAG: hypothetical protein Q8J78_15950, partial [Moraxellaceae bacterium]|nr:hypothetical protein [Moraxellaceae bacterium]